MKYFFALLLAPWIAGAQEHESPRLRLPGDVAPLRYELDLRLVPAEDTYLGTVDIDVNVTKPIHTVWLHARNLDIQKATVGRAEATVITGGTEFLGLQAAVKPGKTRIHIEFSGKFNLNDVEGLFKQVDAGNAYIFTQFEPLAARRAFPCFDEPVFKTPWKLTLRVPKDLKAFANTPVVSQTTEGDLAVIRFAESKPMPTYLVAMAAGPFDVVEVGVAGREKTPIRTITLKGRSTESKYTNEVTPRILTALEDYFGIPYPYEKLDQITIPITVGFGAMENVGLITYTQNLLLSKPEEDSLKRQRDSASVIAHEIAHQWFGNMVTPAWWDDIWLNEAFATWMASRIIDGIFPAWNTEATMVQNRSLVMNQDGLLSSRRIRQPIEEHGDIGNAFDGITYMKGAAIIRMFENYVGPDRFQRGVRGYMRKHAWGVATASDFLNAISSGAGQNISPAFSKFLDRGGFPLITVELKCGEKPAIAVTQERSLPVGSKGSRTEYWTLPVCFRYQAGGKVYSECHMLSDPRDGFALQGNACPEWIVANNNAAGYYHVRYAGDAGKKLLTHTRQLALQEKVDLLNNALALTRGGHLPAGDALALARTFGDAPEREVITASMEIMRSVHRSVPPYLLSRYEKLLRDTYGERALKLGWLGGSGESEDDRLLRQAMVPVVAQLGNHTELVAAAKRLALQWLNNAASVPSDIAPAVLRTAAWHGDQQLYERMIAALRKTTSLRDRDWIVDAIGSFRDPAIAKQALNLLLDNTLDIRELTGLLTAFNATPETEVLPWRFVREHYDQLIERLPSQLGTHGGSILPVGGSAFCSTAGHDEVESFFRDRIQAISGGRRVLAKVLESIQLCEARRTAQTPEVERYLRNLRE